MNLLQSSGTTFVIWSSKFPPQLYCQREISDCAVVWGKKDKENSNKDIVRFIRFNRIGYARAKLIHKNDNWEVYMFYVKHGNATVCMRIHYKITIESVGAAIGPYLGIIGCDLVQCQYLFYAVYFLFKHCWPNSVSPGGIFSNNEFDDLLIFLKICSCVDYFKFFTICWIILDSVRSKIRQLLSCRGSKVCPNSLVLI